MTNEIDIKTKFDFIKEYVALCEKHDICINTKGSAGSIHLEKIDWENFYFAKLIKELVGEDRQEFNNLINEGLIESINKLL